MDSTSSLSGESPVNKDIILEEIKMSETQDRWRRIQFVFTVALLVLLSILTWDCVAHAASLEAGEASAVNQLIMQLVAIVLCACPLLFRNLALVSLVLLGWVATHGAALTATDGQQIITATSMLLSIIYYFGIIRIVRLPSALVMTMILCHILIVLIFTVIMHRNTAFAEKVESHVVFDAIIISFLAVFLCVASRREHMSRVNHLSERYELCKSAMLSEKLLRTILPQHIARKLLQQIPVQELIETYDNASIAFVNLEGAFYKQLVTKKSPAEMIFQLDNVFSYFDDILTQPQYARRVYKLETIGQTYMLMTPYPAAPSDRQASGSEAALLANCVMDILFACENSFGKKLPIRVGINSGPLVAGVIGRSRLFFRVFGDAVNVASRMMSHGEVQRIHMSGTTAEQLRRTDPKEDYFKLESRGEIPIKGSGLMETFWLAPGRRLARKYAKRADILLQHMRRRSSMEARLRVAMQSEVLPSVEAGVAESGPQAGPNANWNAGDRASVRSSIYSDAKLASVLEEVRPKAFPSSTSKAFERGTHSPRHSSAAAMGIESLAGATVADNDAQDDALGQGALALARLAGAIQAPSQRAKQHIQQELNKATGVPLTEAIPIKGLMRTFSRWAGQPAHAKDASSGNSMGSSQVIGPATSRRPNLQLQRHEPLLETGPTIKASGVLQSTPTFYSPKAPFSPVAALAMSMLGQSLDFAEDVDSDGDTGAVTSSSARGTVSPVQPTMASGVRLTPGVQEARRTFTKVDSLVPPTMAELGEVAPPIVDVVASNTSAVSGKDAVGLTTGKTGGFSFASMRSLSHRMLLDAGRPKNDSQPGGQTNVSSDKQVPHHEFPSSSDGTADGRFATADTWLNESRRREKGAAVHELENMYMSAAAGVASSRRALSSEDFRSHPITGDSTPETTAPRSALHSVGSLRTTSPTAARRPFHAEESGADSLASSARTYMTSATNSSGVLRKLRDGMSWLPKPLTASVPNLPLAPTTTTQVTRLRRASVGASRPSGPTEGRQRLRSKSVIMNKPPAGTRISIAGQTPNSQQHVLDSASTAALLDRLASSRPKLPHSRSYRALLGTDGVLQRTHNVVSPQNTPQELLGPAVAPSLFDVGQTWHRQNRGVFGRMPSWRHLTNPPPHVFIPVSNEALMGENAEVTANPLGIMPAEAGPSAGPVSQEGTHRRPPMKSVTASAPSASPVPVPVRHKSRRSSSMLDDGSVRDEAMFVGNSPTAPGQEDDALHTQQLLAERELLLLKPRLESNSCWSKCVRRLMFLTPGFLEPVRLTTENENDFRVISLSQQLLTIGVNLRVLQLGALVYAAASLYYAADNLIKPSSLVILCVVLLQLGLYGLLRSRFLGAANALVAWHRYAKLVVLIKFSLSCGLIVGEYFARFPHTSGELAAAGLVDCSKAYIPVVLSLTTGFIFIPLPFAYETAYQMASAVFAILFMEIMNATKLITCAHEMRDMGGLHSFDDHAGGALLLCISAVLNALLAYEKQQEDRRQYLRMLAAVSAEEDCQNLLENLYPRQVVEALATQQPIRPRLHKKVGILWCDLVGFTPMSKKLGPHNLFVVLNLIYAAFDELIEQHGLWKADTVGDAYICVAGLFDEDEGHVEDDGDLGADSPIVTAEVLQKRLLEAGQDQTHGPILSRTKAQMEQLRKNVSSTAAANAEEPTLRSHAKALQRIKSRHGLTLNAVSAPQASPTTASPSPRSSTPNMLIRGSSKVVPLGDAAELGSLPSRLPTQYSTSDRQLTAISIGGGSSPSRPATRMREGSPEKARMPSVAYSPDKPGETTELRASRASLLGNFVPPVGRGRASSMNVADALLNFNTLVAAPLPSTKEPGSGSPWKRRHGGSDARSARKLGGQDLDLPASADMSRQTPKLDPNGAVRPLSSAKLSRTEGEMPQILRAQSHTVASTPDMAYRARRPRRSVSEPSLPSSASVASAAAEFLHPADRLHSTSSAGSPATSPNVAEAVRVFERRKLSVTDEICENVPQTRPRSKTEGDLAAPAAKTELKGNAFGQKLMDGVRSILTRQSQHQAIPQSRQITDSLDSSQVQTSPNRGVHRGSGLPARGSYVGDGNTLTIAPVQARHFDLVDDDRSPSLMSGMTSPVALRRQSKPILQSEAARQAVMNPRTKAMALQRVKHAAMRRVLDSLFTVAAQMQDVLDIINAECDTEVKMRVGVHCGWVVTGVVGRTRPRFHVYGPTVLVAEEMEHTGQEGRIHCSTEAKNAYLASAFQFLDPFGVDRAAVAPAPPPAPAPSPPVRSPPPPPQRRVESPGSMLSSTAPQPSVQTEAPFIPKPPATASPKDAGFFVQMLQAASEASLPQLGHQSSASLGESVVILNPQQPKGNADCAYSPESGKPRRLHSHSDAEALMYLLQNVKESPGADFPAPLISPKKAHRNTAPSLPGQAEGDHADAMRNSTPRKAASGIMRGLELARWPFSLSATKSPGRSPDKYRSGQARATSPDNDANTNPLSMSQRSDQSIRRLDAEFEVAAAFPDDDAPALPMNESTSVVPAMSMDKLPPLRSFSKQPATDRSQGNHTLRTVSTGLSIRSTTTSRMERVLTSLRTPNERGDADVSPVMSPVSTSGAPRMIVTPATTNTSSSDSLFSTRSPMGAVTDWPRPNALPVVKEAAGFRSSSASVGFASTKASSEQSPVETTGVPPSDFLQAALVEHAQQQSP